MLFSDDYFMKC